MAPARDPAGDPRIWISHGWSDAILSPRNTEEVIVPGLQDLGYSVDFVGFDGGHEVPATVSDAALDWFLS